MESTHPSAKKVPNFLPPTVGEIAIVMLRTFNIRIQMAFAAKAACFSVRRSSADIVSLCLSLSLPHSVCMRAVTFFRQVFHMIVEKCCVCVCIQFNCIRIIYIRFILHRSSNVFIAQNIFLCLAHIHCSIVCSNFVVSTMIDGNGAC